MIIVSDYLQPVRKYSGDTHIKLMIPEIRQAICDELSIEKSHRKSVILRACTRMASKTLLPLCMCFNGHQI